MTEFTLSKHYGPLVNLLMYYVCVYVSASSVYTVGLAESDNFTINVLLISICSTIILLAAIMINKIKHQATPTWSAPLVPKLNDRIKWAIWISTVVIIATTGWK
jgi:hypothetical protein